MKNWKRILAAAGTAALLVSNLGSVTQAVFATEDPTEEVRTPDETEAEPEESTETAPDVDLQSIASEAPVSEESAESTGEPGKELPEGSDDGTGEGADGETTGSGSESDGSAEAGSRNDGGSTEGSEASESTAQGTGAADGTGSGTANAEGSAQDTAESKDTGTESAESTASGNGDGESHNTANGTGESTGTDKGSAAANGTEGSGATADEPAGSAEDGGVIPGSTEGGETSEDEESEDEDDEQEVYDLKDSLTISLETKESKKCDPARNDDGVYLYNLGETASTTIKIANPEAYTLEESDDAVVRLYMRFTDIAAEDDEDTETTVTTANIRTKRPGKYTIEAEDGTEYDYTVYEVEDGLYCYEIERPIDADTISLEVTSVYSDSSDDDNNTLGGENQIWVVALTEEEAATLDGIELVDEDDDEDAESDDESNEESQDEDDAETTDEDAEASDKDDDADSEETSDTDADNDDQDAEDTSDDDADAAEQDDEESADSEDDADEDSDDASDADADKKVDASDKGKRSASDRTNRETVGVADVPDDDAYVDILLWERDVMSEIEVQTAETENYIVSVAYGPEANIPEDAELRVVEYDQTTDKYWEICEESDRALAWVLDVAFYVTDDKGKDAEIEPDQPVSISVTYRDEETDVDDLIAVTERRSAGQAATATTVSAEDSGEDGTLGTEGNGDQIDYILHYAESGVEDVEAEGCDEAQTITFTLGSLSIVAMPYDATIDTSGLKSVRVNQGINLIEESGASNRIALRSIDNDGNTSPAITDHKIVSNEEEFSGIKDAYIDYASDRSTSDIESEFEDSTDQDGMLVSDKSVIYGTDDYNAFDSYDDGVFSVTLSALEQEYSTEEEDSYTVPIDVVFVLDVSNSMKDPVGDRSNQKKRDAMVNAVNTAIRYIYRQNEQSRIGIALFSTSSEVLLPMGRYTTTTTDNSGNDQYMVVRDNKVQIVENGLTSSDGTKYSGDGGMTQNLGTFTQGGIAQGYEIFKGVNDTSYTVKSQKGQTITGTRQPVFILLTDGVPTHGSHDYNNVLDNDCSGDGQDLDNKVIEGYYTILSANYYKGKVTKKYFGTGGADTAKFYTIGEGLNSIENQSSPSDADAYANAVLNPSSEIMTQLNNLSGTRVTNLKAMLNKGIGYRNGREYTAYSDGQSIQVGRRTDLGVNNGYEYYYKSGIEKYPNYSYCDQAWFGNLTQTQLEDAFKSIVNKFNRTTSYIRANPDGSKVVLTDPIGEGMEVKNKPYLHVGNDNIYPSTDPTHNYEQGKGNNYAPTSSTTIRNGDGSETTTYVYNYKGLSGDNLVFAELYGLTYFGSDATINQILSKPFDFSKITVTVTTAVNGTQTVKMNVPAELVPLNFSDTAGGEASYMYEAPIRLIYQVGLTDAAIGEANALEDGESKTYYTNRWKGESATGEFEITSDNPYYKNYSGSSKSKGEDNNPTETSDTYRTESKNSNTSVTQTLGNNGRLTISKKKLQVDKKWFRSDGVTEMEPTSVSAISATLYQKDTETLSGSVTTNTIDTFELNKDNEWKKVFYTKDLNEQDGHTYSYYVTENTTLENYTTEILYGDQEHTLTPTKGNVTLTIKNIWIEYALPSTGGLGTLPLELGGSAALLTSMFVGYSRRRRHRKEGEM